MKEKQVNNKYGCLHCIGNLKLCLQDILKKEAKEQAAARKACKVSAFVPQWLGIQSRSLFSTQIDDEYFGH
jgi:hypothetical protein